MLEKERNGREKCAGIPSAAHSAGAVLEAEPLSLFGVLPTGEGSICRQDFGTNSLCAQANSAPWCSAWERLWLRESPWSNRSGASVMLGDCGLSLGLAYTPSYLPKKTQSHTIIK